MKRFMQTLKVEKLVTKNTMKKLLSISILIILGLSNVTTLEAFTIEKHEGVPVEKNFVVGPAKIESEVKAGEVKTVNLVIDNKTGRAQTFTVHFEDFTSGSSDEQVVQLLGAGVSNTSLKNFLSVEKKEFTLDQGDRAIVPVTISIPVGEKSGGKFGAVVVSAVAKRNAIIAEGDANTGAVIIGNVASLFFVTVPGDVKYDASLVSVKTKNNARVFFGSSVPFRLQFQNSGNVSVNPYGILIVKNMFGHKVTSVVLDPSFVLPGSTRTRDVTVETQSGFGYYTAIAQVNRGYENIVDEKQISFVLVPKVALGGILVVVIFLGFIFVRRFRNTPQV